MISETIFGWSTAVLVLAGVATASADPTSGHWLNAAALSMGAIWLIRMIFRDYPGTHWLITPLLGAAVWGIIQLSMHWTVYEFRTWNEVTTWLGRAAVFQLAYVGLANRETRDRVFSFLLIAGCAISIVGTIQFFTSDGKILWLVQTAYKDGVIGTFLNRDHYAVFIELLLPIALARALLDSGPRLPYAVIAAVMYASVIGCGAKAGAAIVTMETAIVVAVVLRRGVSNYRWILVLALCMVVSTGIVGWSYLWERVQLSDPFAIRREMLVATFQMILAKPLTGFGLGTWSAAYPAFAVFDPPGVFMNHAHNDWAEWIAEGGILFGAGLLVVATAAISLARKHWWALGIPAALVHALVDFPMQKPSLGALAFFLLGAAAAASKATPNSRHFGSANLSTKPENIF